MPKANNSKWFMTVGGVMSFKLKITKHIQNKNADKLKDYLCLYFDFHKPETGSFGTFVGKDQATEVIKILSDGGYTTHIQEWKQDGIQFVLHHKATDSYYRSKFAW